MASLLPRVKSRLFIHANRRTTNLLDGAYASLHVGRSLDFDDLRVYVPGDQVEDIDWKATARTGQPLVKRYLQTRRQDVLFLVDTGRGMAAVAEGGEAKRDLAIDIVGVLGFLALKHGDSVGMITHADGRVRVRPPKSTEGYLESLLRGIRDETTLDGEQSDITELLRHVARVLRNRGILVVVADDLMPPDDLDDTLKALGVRHELLWITVADLDLISGDGSRRQIVGVEDDQLIPTIFRSDRKLRRLYAEAATWRIDSQRTFFTRLAVSHARVGSIDAVVPTLLNLLRRRSRAGI
ncbi:DUF58 domain-containing protein [Schumannella luteola]|uniref:Uncharacterized protein (DUF58 family) n=1 Tax=Schumannella luteola TaxID=472059 RepID=A0A852YKI3_9MICO|nr:DUF58 domain-containing protein [Schumannella luteola]NYG99698.1 uncharacterized protein (DUF58 family) [Schumannella luteola]TPX06480.1 DUF58 domain-containing protein [Schumannella luteola]